jgi:hypothetical protein
MNLDKIIYLPEILIKLSFEEQCHQMNRFIDYWLESPIVTFRRKITAMTPYAGLYQHGHPQFDRVFYTATHQSGPIDPMRTYQLLHWSSEDEQCCWTGPLENRTVYKIDPIFRTRVNSINCEQPGSITHQEIQYLSRDGSSCQVTVS